MPPNAFWNKFADDSATSAPSFLADLITFDLNFSNLLLNSLSNSTILSIPFSIAFLADNIVDVTIREPLIRDGAIRMNVNVLLFFRTEIIGTSGLLLLSIDSFLRFLELFLGGSVKFFGFGVVGIPFFNSFSRLFHSTSFVFIAASSIPFSSIYFL